MKLVDLIAIHWTGGLGMFGILQGKIFLGIIAVIAAEVVYELMERKRRG